MNYTPPVSSPFATLSLPATTAAVNEWLRRANALVDVESQLKSLTPRLESVTRTLLAHPDLAPYKPRIVYAWRHPATQKRLVESGFSTVNYSRHNVVVPVEATHTLVMDAHAVDLVPSAATSEKEAAAFYAVLRDLVSLYDGFRTGADYSQPAVSIWTPYGLGWDPGHVEYLKGSRESHRHTYTAAISRWGSYQFALRGKMPTKMPPALSASTTAAAGWSALEVAALGFAAWLGTRMLGKRR